MQSSPIPLREARARPRAALLAIACTLAGTAAYADTPAPPGADALATARTAWAQKHFAAAELSYKSALDHGGLSPSDTLDAYIHLGAARARHGKKELARAAFRQAALIDRHFKTPAEGGKRAAQIAAFARHDEAKIGSIVLGATLPSSLTPGTAFDVEVTIDAKHAGLTAKVGVDALDPATGRHWSTTDVAAARKHFQVPGSVATSGATLLVRVDALDVHENRLATREQRIVVQTAAPPPVAEEPPANPMRIAVLPPTAPQPPPPALGYTAEIPPAKPVKEGGKHGGVFSSPWFYIVGGAVLAAGGAFAFYELRPSDNVSLGGARVVTR